MGFNPPVPQQDSNWEIRVALLLSLLLQVLLIFLGPMRKRSASVISRFIIWSCYLLADWVADLGLGLILNNMGNIGGGGTASTAGKNNSSPIIFAFWAPFLLLHLGGPDTITAYSLEDNELWPRHLIGLLFELFSACVIFFCSLRGNPLIHATVLMFVVGVIKYAERTFSLYYGSVDGLRNMILYDPDSGPNYAKLMTEFDSKKKAGLVVRIDIANGEAELAHKEMERQETERLEMDKKKSVEARAYEFFLIFRRLFVNVVLSFQQRRLMSQVFFLRDTEETRRSDEDELTMSRRVLEVIEAELNFIYDMVYTKAPVAYTRNGWVFRGICSCCLVAALVIFFFLDKHGHQIWPVDVGITYALLLGGLALDVTALLMIFFSSRAQVYLETNKCWGRLDVTALLRWLARLRKAAKLWRTRRWSGKTSQLNLISQALGKPDRFGKGAALCLRLSKVASCLHIDDIVNEFVFIRRVRVKDKEDEKERCGRLRRFFREALVPKCCRNKENVSESLLFGFVFRGIKGALRKLKEEQEERKKAAAAQKAAAPEPAAGTRDQEATTEEEEMEAEKEAMAEKDAITEVGRRRGDGVVKSHEGDIKLGKATTTDGNGAKSHEVDDIKRGKGTKEDDARFKVILDSVVKSEFDESLLLWHIATDLCLQRNYLGPMPKEIIDMRAIAETLSEYMLYLLIKQPDMLAATAGNWLMRYQDTFAEAWRFFDSMAAWDPDHEDARRMLLSVNTSKKPVQVKGDRSKSVLFDAVILAKALRELHEEVMWELVSGVWTEMMLYAARSCPSSTHVRHLSRGGELITIIWFLIEHMGLGNAHDVHKVVDVPAKLMVHK